MNKFNIIILFVAAVIVGLIVRYFMSGTVKNFYGFNFSNSFQDENKFANLNKEFATNSFLGQSTFSSLTATFSNTVATSALDPKLALLNLQFYTAVEERFAEIVKKIHKVKTLDIEGYKKEIQKISNKFKQYGDIKITDTEKAAEILLALVNELSNVNPPEVAYDTHLNLIKKYLTLAMALKEYSLATSQAEKNAMYNIIIMTLKQLSVN
ncbi:MAG: hypothetical protein KatS3mg097_312 [Candidatus Parcubacteria bacterium]|nr:MAG: hypothetical protein KatS3mg097_312 [Candidatus Parcubacteria bacterium]